MTGAWLSTAAGGVWPWLAHAATERTALAVLDSTLAGGPAFADYVAHMQLPAFEVGDDIGALWYTTLAQLFAQSKAHGHEHEAALPSLIGLMRPADYFVLKQLATRVGPMIEHRHEQGTGRIAHVAFVLAPRVDR